MKMDFKSKCRTCLSENLAMFDLFVAIENELTLAEVLQNCTLIQVEDDPNYSQFICSTCTSTLIEFYNFKTIFEENEKCINSLAGGITVENTEKHQFNVEIDNDVLLDPKGILEKVENSNENVDHIKENLIDDDVREVNDHFEHAEKLKIIGNCSVTQGPTFFKKYDGEKLLYFCIECNTSFSKKVDIWEHILENHNEEDLDDQEPELKVKNKDFLLEGKGRTCTVCKEIFEDYEELEAHRLSHKRYICEVCTARFIKKKDLDDHRETHSTTMRYKCPFCSKSFRLRSTFTRHKRVHTNPRAYVCELCGNRFNDRKTMNTHIDLIHIRDRKYMCNMCGLKFPLRSTLNKHILRHNKHLPKKYKCNSCEKCYKDKSSLNKHYEIKHSDNKINYSCELCDRRYTTKTNLLKHSKTKH